MTTAPQRDTDDLRTRSLAELIKRLGSDTSTLVRGELRLAKQEVTDKVAALAGGAAGIVLGAVLAVFGLAVLVAAAVLGLATALPAWLSALIIGGGLVIVGALAAFIGIALIKRSTPPVPTKSIENAKEDLQWVRQHVISKQS